MAEQVLSEVVSPMVEMAVQNISTMVRDRYNLSKNVKKDVEAMKLTLTAIQSVLEDAEKKQVSSSLVRDWLGKLSELATDAVDVLDSWMTERNKWEMKRKVSKFHKPFPLYKMSFQTNVALRIKEISATLKKINEDKEKLDLMAGTNEQDPLRVSRLTISFVRELDVVGRDFDRDEILKLLLPAEGTSSNTGRVPVIPIIGMGGLGKTTLAQFIYNDDRVKAHFQLRMWVCVTEDFNLDRILRELMTDEDRKHTANMSREYVAKRALEQLTKKRYLLVLDDVWSMDYATEWKPLEDLLTQGPQGSRILLTSRAPEPQVLNLMGADEPYRLSFLPPDKCWDLFVKTAFGAGRSMDGIPQEIENSGRRIVDKCNGLPLAVVQMGALLRGKSDVDEWRRIEHSEIWRLQNSNDPTSNINNNIVLPVLKLSYHYLSSPLKQCFAYCSIFPKAHVFDESELVKLWMAQKFIVPHANESLEQTGSRWFTYLLVRFFFQPTEDDKRYRMHDLIHDLAQFVSVPHSCQVKGKDVSGISEKSLHVSLINKDDDHLPIDAIFNSKKLRTLVWPSTSLNSRSLDDMFHSMRFIRVLDLSSTKISELPKSIKKLRLLHFLNLSNTKIKKLPDSICGLYNLQTLKLLQCPWLSELPKDLVNLINLRHLELDDIFWYKFSEFMPRISRIPGLHDLNKFRVGLAKDGCGIEELKALVELTGTLSISDLENARNSGDAKLKEKTKLQKLELSWSSGRDVTPREEADLAVLRDLEPHSNLKELQINGYQGPNFPYWVTSGALSNLHTIYLYHCSNCETLSLGPLPFLRKLCIKGMIRLIRWEEAEILSGLNWLEVKNCPGVIELPAFFPSLRVLKIKGCTSLRAVPVGPVQFMTLIDNLALDEWIERIPVTSQHEESQEQVLFLKRSFLHLLELKLINCPSLRTLPEIFAPQKLEISGCRRLNSLPDETFCQRLQCLSLEAFDDAGLVKLIPDSGTLYSLVISNISQLSSFPKWPSLPSLQALYISGCEDLVNLCEGDDESLQSLPSLKLMEIQNCHELVTLPTRGLPQKLEILTIRSCSKLSSFGPSDVFQRLTSLTDLYIEDCPALQSLPRDGFHPSLQHLSIRGCALLTENCLNGGDRPRIEHLRDKEIETV